jgi:hypothetical protein
MHVYVWKRHYFTLAQNGNTCSEPSRLFSFFSSAFCSLSFRGYFSDGCAAPHHHQSSVNWLVVYVQWRFYNGWWEGVGKTDAEDAYFLQHTWHHTYSTHGNWKQRSDMNAYARTPVKKLGKSLSSRAISPFRLPDDSAYCYELFRKHVEFHRRTRWTVGSFSCQWRLEKREDSTNPFPTAKA